MCVLIYIYIYKQLAKVVGRAYTDVVAENMAENPVYIYTRLAMW